MIAVPEYTSIVLHLRRVAVASFVSDWCYMMEDTSNPCSS